MRAFLRSASHTYEALSHSGRSLFHFFAALCVVSSIALVYLLNSSLLVSVPAHGGSYSEGIIGSPRFINPVLALSDADRDLTALIYSGLLRATPEGSYVPDLAQSYTISSDGKTYTFILRPNVTFHDGTKLTADDVIYTVSKAQDPALKSPARANWDGVVATKVDDHTVTFTLKQAYSPFIENLTLGILPKARWQGVSDDEFSFSDLNTKPVGSGPFKVSTISRTSSGIPSSYELGSFKNYALGEPYLASLVLRFYQSESALATALKNGEIEGASGISPSTLDGLKGFSVKKAPLNRVFGVFFNQNQSTILRDADVRHALDLAINRDALVDEVLDGYGTVLTGPVPPSLVGDATSTNTAPIGTSTDKTAAARDYLIKKGWAVGSDGVLTKTTGSGKTASTVSLTFSLTTDNVPELRAAAEQLKQDWEKMGAKVQVQIYDQGDLSQNVIRPRKYDALLFGEIIGREVDLFAFWHSSQRNDPGLNIALYANSTADKILEQLRTTSSDTQRQALYSQFNAELQKDIPALFLYAPDFVYIVPNDIEGFAVGFIETPADRFLSVAQWHRQVDSVWPIFGKTN